MRSREGREEEEEVRDDAEESVNHVPGNRREVCLLSLEEEISSPPGASERQKD
jgi:hypothetical protein